MKIHFKSPILALHDKAAKLSKAFRSPYDLENGSSDLQLQLQQWGIDNFYLLVLSKAKRYTLPKTPLP
jgi:hypothetical protein